MNIHILGTSAAEGWPALFCKCDSCLMAKKIGGRNIRTRSSILIDEILKVDFPPDSYSHMLNYNFDMEKLEYLLISHSHNDHFDFAELEYLTEGFNVVKRNKPLNIYANKNALKKLSSYLKDNSWSELQANLKEVLPFQTINAKPYLIHTLKANHGGDKNPLNYIIEKAGKSFLYTCDTGYYKEKTWDFLKGFYIDLGIIECTEGPKRVDYGTHLGIPNFLEFREKCEEIGFSDNKTKWILTHFSHGGGMIYDEMIKLESKYNFMIAFDGMKLTV